MYGLWRVIVKELFQLRHDRKMIPVLVAGPLIQMLALGYAANTDVNRIPTLLVDQDRTPASRALVDRFTGSGYFALVGAVATPNQVEPWLVDGFVLYQSLLGREVVYRELRRYPLDAGEI